MTLKSRIFHLTPARRQGRSQLKQGFTLIELLVVIAIIGILTVISVASFLTAQKQTRDARRKGDLEQIRQALESYRSEVGTYPVALSALSPSYITNLPSDPKNGTYAYSRLTATTYNLCAGLEITPAVSACGSLNCTSMTCNYLTENP